MLLTWIAEIADEPLVLDPTDRSQEWETNTWWLSAEEEDRKALSVSDVTAAFEATAEALRHRIHEMGFPGTATSYVWHDGLADQIRCSTGSVTPEDLPFSAAHTPSTDLRPILEGFLAAGEAAREPTTILWADLNNAHEPALSDSPAPPFPVWVHPVGSTTP